MQTSEKNCYSSFFHPQYFEMRFGKSIRYFCSILFTVGMVSMNTFQRLRKRYEFLSIFMKVLYLPVAIYVPALTFNQVSGIDIYTITPVVCVVCTFYTCAVSILTDLFCGFRDTMCNCFLFKGRLKGCGLDRCNTELCNVWYHIDNLH